ncbi:MAG: S8 family serine peptidase [Acidobacteriota bacterium]|nr:S8 family serine peptidase [Acidobacteriota bacterium]
MHRLSAVLLSLFLSQAVFAGVNESGPRNRDDVRERLGRAVILESHQTLSDADVADLAAQGVIVRRALSGGRYIARVKDEAATADERIASIEPMTTRMKLQRSAVHEAAKAKPFARVNVIFHDDVDFDSARQAILDAGGQLDDVLRLKFSPSQRLAVRIPPAALDALVSDERVMTISGPAPRLPRTENANSAAVSHVTEVLAAPYGLSGEGVDVSLFELAEAQGSHAEFGGRLTVNALGGSASDKSHATHVAGTIGAGGVNPAAKGMAPKARIHQYCLEVPANDCEGEWLDLKDQELNAHGIVADNNSWGYELGWYNEDGFPVWDGSDIFFGSYIPDFGGPFVDEISIDRKVLFVHSAGNNGNSGAFATQFSQHRHVDDEGDAITTEFFCYSLDNSGTDCPALCNGTNPDTGAPAGCEKTADRHHTTIPFDTLGVVASAKNVIAVGALTGPVGFSSIASLSSRGPAKDGRVKPDVVARGVSVFSPTPTNGYENKQGTSMAAPVVTGIAALLTEQWRLTFAGASPLPEQLKALILIGADEIGNPGPDYTHGFGIANAKNAVDLIRADAGTGARIRNMSFNQGQIQTIEFPLVVSQQQNLEVLLNWSDPPTILLGDDEITDPVLVNDLDLKVIDPASNTVFPYVLDRLAFQANATRGVNSVDNTELVEIANAPAGTYRVIITGSRVAKGPQTAVLVATAALGNAVIPCVDLVEKLGSNDTPASAFGNLAPGQKIDAAICTASDVDHYKFTATKTGPVSIFITTGNTPIRATLTATGVNIDVNVPANSQGELNASATAVPLNFVLKIEANGTLGSAPLYSFTPQFGETVQARRRSVGR